VYVSAHDNETLFDAIQLKASPAASLQERIRMHRLALALVMFCQGIPFFLAGDELLRSKSLDRNSYNSGDWFNALDFTGAFSHWGIGLPPGENQAHWPLMASLLANPALKPTGDQILETAACFREFLQIRRSSRLFHLRTAEEIEACIRFYNTGPNQIPGFLVMEIMADRDTHPGPGLQRLVLVFNARPEEQAFTEGSLREALLVLHPVLAKSSDKIVRQSRFYRSSGTLNVPGRTAAVFVTEKVYPSDRIIRWLRQQFARWFQQAKDQ
jgi:pullulanase/glycogen debranching enzyme